MKSKLVISLLALVSILVLLGCEDKKYVVAPDDIIPATPVGVYSVTGDGYVDIYWPVNNDDGITDGYAVYYYVRTEGNQDVYEKLAEGNDIDIEEPDYESSDVMLGHYRDTDVQNGVTYRYAVSAYNDNGESDLSFLDAWDTPRPDGGATIDLTSEDQNSLGWDFSQQRTRSWNSIDADIFFEYDDELGSFFIWSAHDDVFIQDFGYVTSLTSVGWGEPGGGWENVGWIEMSEGHAYIVGIGDLDQDGTSENYGVVWITGLNYGSQEVRFEWAYQTQEFNPELKRNPNSGPFPSQTRYMTRSGN